MNKSVPTLLGIVIILLVVVLVVLVVNYKVTKGLGEGKQVMGTVGGEILTGEETPDEVIDASTVLGSREPEPAEATTLSPEQQRRMQDRRADSQERREERTGRGAPGGGTE
jgi:hypothetical protein